MYFYKITQSHKKQTGMVAAMKDIQQKNSDNFESQLAWMNTSFAYGNLEAEVCFKLRNQKK